MDQLNYPKELLEIFIGDDDSEDGSDWDGIVSEEPRSQVEYDLRPIESDKYWQWYQLVYQRFLIVRPDAKDRIQPQSKESLEECRHNGLLYGAFSEKRPVGLIAGKYLPFLGHEALFINEITIHDDYRGKWMAPSMQWRFIKEKAQGKGFVWGTIDNVNRPSLRTAAGVGRKIVSSEHFVAL